MIEPWIIAISVALLLLAIVLTARDANDKRH
jgi:hypothetical protein